MSDDELPMDRSGYVWRFVVGGVLGLFVVIPLARMLLFPVEGPHDGESRGWALLGVAFIFAPLSATFLVSGFGLYRGWSGGLVLRILPAVVFAIIIAGLIWSDCV